MAIDFNALRKKLDKLQGQNDSKSSIWKPAAGNSVIRIVPWKDRPDNPFIELYFHYLGRKTQLSPLTNGNPDPIAEFAESLRASGDKDDWKYSRQFFPKLRTFVPVIVRGEEDKGVRFWGFGKTVLKTLLEVIADDDWGDITDPQAGRDIGIKFIPEKESNTDFAQTEVLVKPKQTPITDDAKQLETWLTTQPDILEVFEEPTYDDLKAFLERFLDPDADKSATTSERSSESSESETKEEVVKATSDSSDENNDSAEEESNDTSDVGEEFAKLFADG